MRPVCEIMVQEVFPGLRAMIAINLQEKYGMNQSEVAKRLGISQPAISQYIRHLRGSKKETKIFKNKKVENEVNRICEKISRGTNYEDLVEEFCKICKLIRKNGLICEMHKDIYDLKDCALCKD